MAKTIIPIPTMSVTHKESGTTLVINAADFNSEQHVKTAATRAKLGAPEAPEPTKPLAEQLGDLSIADLKAHPLYNRVADAETYTKKAALVAAMLDAAQAV